MKSTFANAGLSDIPVSISELAYGWQISGDISSMVDAVDFFMINNFPELKKKEEAIKAGEEEPDWNLGMDQSKAEREVRVYQAAYDAALTDARRLCPGRSFRLGPGTQTLERDAGSCVFQPFGIEDVDSII